MDFFPDQGKRCSIWLSVTLPENWPNGPGNWLPKFPSKVARLGRPSTPSKAKRHMNPKQRHASHTKPRQRSGWAQAPEISMPAGRDPQRQKLQTPGAVKTTPDQATH
eukprot:2636626-Amphidinium_carterae.2